MQYRRPVGFGPSLNTWPRWASHRLHRTSVRLMKRLLSVSVFTLFWSITVQKLGHPVRESNLVSELNRSLIAANALVDTRLVTVPVRARERSFGSLLSGDVKLFGGKQPSPFLIRLDNLIRHNF